MKKSILTILLSGFFLFTALCQDSYIKNRLNFKLAYSRYNNGWYSGMSSESQRMGNYRLEANYGVTRHIETGLYAGFSSYQSMTNYWSYGINANYHLLPFIIDSDNFRFDLYFAGKFGGWTSYFTLNNSFSSIDYSHRSPLKLEYGFGPGVSFYLWKHLGIFTEYCFGKYYYKENSNLRYGLTLKF